MPFHDTGQYGRHLHLDVALTRWLTVVILLAFLLVNTTFCLYRVAAGEKRDHETREFWDQHVAYVMDRDAQWLPMLQKTVALVDRITEAERVRAIARAKVEAEAETAKKSAR